MNPPNKTLTLLFNPFYYLAGGPALGLGLAVMLLAGLAGAWGHTHFDGVLDMHSGAAGPLWLFLGEGVMDWLCLSAVLWACGKIISPGTFRAVDLFGTQALARWPALGLCLLTLPPALQRVTNELVAQLQQGAFQINPADAVVFGLLVILMIPFFCWMVVLMYKAFSVSCNVRGGKAIGTFIGGLFVAELVSKVFMVLMLAHATPALAAAGPTAVGGPGAVPAVHAEGDTDLVAAGVNVADLLVKADFAGVVVQYDATMKSALPEPKLREAWQTLLQQAGPFQKRLGTRQEAQAGYQIVFVTCQFERATLDIKVVFNAERQVAGLFFVPATLAGPGAVPAVHAEGDPDLVAAGGNVADLLVKADFAGVVAQYDATMKGALPEPKLREAWQTLLQQAGPFQKRLGTRQEAQAGYQIVFVTCQFERAALDIKVVFNAERQVAGLFFVPATPAGS